MYFPRTFVYLYLPLTSVYSRAEEVLRCFVKGESSERIQTKVIPILSVLV